MEERNADLKNKLIEMNINPNYVNFICLMFDVAYTRGREDQLNDFNVFQQKSDSVKVASK